MKTAVPALALACFLLAGCPTTPHHVITAKTCDDKPVVIVEVVQGAQKRVRVDEEPIYVCTPRKITWEIHRDQRREYEFRDDSIEILQDPLNQFTNCKGPARGELDGRHKIKCNDLRTATGGPWKYAIKVYESSTGTGIKSDPFIVND